MTREQATIIQEFRNDLILASMSDASMQRVIGLLAEAIKQLSETGR